MLKGESAPTAQAVPVGAFAAISWREYDDCDVLVRKVQRMAQKRSLGEGWSWFRAR